MVVSRVQINGSWENLPQGVTETPGFGFLTMHKVLRCATHFTKACPNNAFMSSSAWQVYSDMGIRPLCSILLHGFQLLYNSAHFSWPSFHMLSLAADAPITPWKCDGMKYNLYNSTWRHEPSTGPVCLALLGDCVCGYVTVCLLCSSTSLRCYFSTSRTLAWSTRLRRPPWTSPVSSVG